MEKKEAIEIVRKLYNESLFMKKDKEAVVTLIPELKNSEDEKIRKNCIHFLELQKKHHASTIEIDECIAWLEKQGEYKETLCDKYKKEQPSHSCQDITELGRCYLEHEKQSEKKPTDEVKPKFKVGDYIINEYGFIIQIDRIDGNMYVYHVLDDNCILKHDITKTDESCHLWTIQDAKDGDVLCCENGWTCIFKALNSDISFSSYCFMDSTEWFCEAGSESHTLEKAFIKAYNGNIYPATKEQRDLLFTKMKEAGYEWDIENKELKITDYSKYVKCAVSTSDYDGCEIS